MNSSIAVNCLFVSNYAVEMLKTVGRNDYRFFSTFENGGASNGRYLCFLEKDPSAVDKVFA